MKKIIIGAALLYLLSAFYPANHLQVWGADTGQKKTESVSDADSMPVKAIKITNITISMAGDVTLGNNQKQGYAGTFNEKYDLKGKDYFFKNVKSVFEEDDMTIVNFEGVLTNSNGLVKKEWNMKGKPKYSKILTAGSIEAVSLGNNHRMDYGKQGEADTLKALKKDNITYAYDNNVGIYKVKGIRIGYVSVNQVYDGKKVESYLQKGIRKLKEKKVDLILACCHWGIERVYYPNQTQTNLAHKCIDWGADLVIGCHPHVLQGVEKYKGAYIVYSLGNFCFGGNRNPADKETMIAQITFTFEDGERLDSSKLQIIPCTLSSVSYVNDFQPTIATGSKKKKILSHINQYSKKYGIQFNKDGIANK